MKNEPGYPLPDGELGSDDIVCQLVYLPDRPEYWQAFLGALSYMTTWRAWERDDDKRGKDAAANWREAFELTMECWRMACLEQLQDDVAEILAIMQLGNTCCDEMDFTDGDQYTDRVEDGEGDVPQNIIDAGYAEDAADWDGFDDYKCMIAHVAVNQMEERLREMDDVIERTGPYLAVAAALSAILGVIVATGGLAIVFGILAGIGTVSALYYALTEFGSIGDLADDVATNHDALACSIYFADGDVMALSNLNSKIDYVFTAAEALILKNLNMGPTLKALYAGRYDQQDMAEILFDAGYDVEDFDCECTEQIGEYLKNMPFDVGEDYNWALNNGFYLNPLGGTGATPYRLTTPNAQSGYIQAGTWIMRNWQGIPDTAGKKMWLNRLSFWHKMSNPNGGVARITINDDTGLTYYDFTNSDDVWTYVTQTFPSPHEVTGSQGYVLRLSSHGGTQGDLHFDEITLDYDIEE